jgi:hypothetical protein
VEKKRKEKKKSILAAHGMQNVTVLYFIQCQQFLASDGMREGNSRRTSTFLLPDGDSVSS